jgi:hypothetical protein
MMSAVCTPEGTLESTSENPRNGIADGALVVLPDAVWETSSDNLGMQLADAPGGPAGAAAGSLRRMPSAAAAVLRRDGLRGFYRGIVPELGKVVPGVGIAFSVYEFCKRQLGCDT